MKVYVECEPERVYYKAEEKVFRSDDPPLPKISRINNYGQVWVTFGR